MLSIGAGTGLIYLMRWFWSRVNAWSEIAAMVSSFVIAVALFVAGKMGIHIAPHRSLSFSVAATSIVWITVTFLTKPSDRSKLMEFYRLVRPAGPGWRSIRAEAGVGDSPDRLSESMLGWTLGCAFVYAALFGAGSFLYGKTAQGLLWSAIFVVSLFGLSRVLPRVWSDRHD
jgi:Na+/proline symporter